MTEKLYSVINACRLCQSPSLDTVYQFGGVPLANAYPETSSQQEVKFPLTLVRCTKCGHVQLRETVNPEVLFTNYSYASADSPALVKHFHEYASTIKSRLDLTNDSFLLEVGCNDGLLLREFVNLGMVNLFGIEPALNMAEKLMGSGAFIINQYFNKHTAKQIFGMHGPMDVICANNVFAHVADVESFAQGVASLLSPNGVFVFENAYLLDTIKGLYFDQCLTPGQMILTQNGLVKIEEVKIADKVLSHLGNWREVEHTFKNKYNGKIVNIFTYGNSKPLSLTPNHPVYVSRNGVKQFIEAKNIITSDILLKAHIKSSEQAPALVIEHRVGNNHKNTQYTFNVDTKLCKIFGYFVAEGHYYECKVGSSQVDFSFGKSESEKLLAQDCAECLIFHQAKATVKLTKFGWRVTTYGAMARLLKREFGTGAKNKNLPFWLFNLPNELTQTFLESYIKGDGYIYRNGKYLRASTVSANLAYGISFLSNKLGFPCSINIGKTLPPHKIANNRKTSFLVNPPIDILIRMKPSAKIKVWSDNDYQYNSIRKITQSDFCGFVYNLEVSQDNSYTMNQGSIHNCYHEHLQYYGIVPLINFLGKFGLEIFDIQHIDTQGGSFRIFAKKKESTKWSIEPSVEQWVANEKANALYEPSTYVSFRKQIESLVWKVRQFLANYDSNTSIACYGCPAKFALFSQVFNLDSSRIKYVVDESPLKYGRFSPGKKIPIVDRDYFLNNPPDLCIISVWNMASSVMSRNPQFKGKWITLMPDLKII